MMKMLQLTVKRETYACLVSEEVLLMRKTLSFRVDASLIEDDQQRFSLITQYGKSCLYCKGYCCQMTRRFGPED
jgi:hypothetical protein